MASTPEERAARRRMLRSLWASAMRYRGRVIGSMVLLVLAKLAAVAVPLALKAIIDTFSEPDALQMLPVFLLLGYALLRFSSTLFTELRDTLFARVTHQTVADFTLRAFSHLHSLGPRFHAQRRTGGVIRDVERGAAGITFLLGVALFSIGPTLFEMGAVLVILVGGYSLWFIAIIAATLVTYAIYTAIFIERRAPHQRALNELNSAANGRLVDSLLNYETVKYYANERFEAKRYREVLQKWVRVGVRTQNALSRLHVGQSGVIAAGVAAVMVFAGQEVLLGRMTIGDLVLVNAYILQIAMPLNSLGSTFRQSRDALVDAERLFSIFAQEPDITEPEKTVPLQVKAGEVRFERVSFCYEPGRQILWDVDLRIPPGGTVAVVGGSGSGKSTLARLLFRFYDPASGRVLIDDQDLRTVSPRSLRQNLGIVPQDTILFNDTIAYNIAYGNPGASIADVIRAAEAAQIHELISALPEQYETMVGERGVKLSGGEKQRMAIARALLKNPKILVFDEATSALDTRAERAIQEQLDRIARNRTTLVIAHRLSTVVNADEILVLERGRIVERGRHPDLLARKGLYAQMWSLQQQERELEKAERRLAMQPVTLETLVAGVIDGLRGAIEARNVRLYTTLGAEPSRITGDPSSLQRMTWDLLAHAIQASPPGGRVELRLERAGPHARLSIVDTAERSAIVPASEADEDAPLDFARIRAIAEQHRGQFQVGMAEPGPGNRYVLEIPLRAVAPAEGGAAFDGQPAPALPDRKRPLHGLRVMIVDDEDEARDLITTLLEGYGAQVMAEATGAAALTRLSASARAEWPDVLVCDIALRDEDGYAVLNALRALEAKREIALTQRLPAIALSGYARLEDRMRALMAGFQVHLAKPVAAEELMATISSLAGTRPLPAPTATPVPEAET